MTAKAINLRNVTRRMTALEQQLKAEDAALALAAHQWAMDYNRKRHYQHSTLQLGAVPFAIILAGIVVWLTS